MATPQAGMNRFFVVVGVLALAGVGALVYLSTRPKVSIPVNVEIAVSDTAGFSGYYLGSEKAPVEITEYADYQCPACGDFETVQFPDVRSRLIETGKLRWRFRDFPLPMHKNARVAAHSAACAADQGKFWEQHRAIFQGQTDWSQAGDAGKAFREYGKQNGLDLTAYDACMTAAKFAGRIQASVDEGIRVGIQATPSFVIGGRLYSGNQPYDRLKAMVDSLANTVVAAPTP